MARFKRRIRARSGRIGKRHSRRSSNSGGLFTGIIPAVSYGAVRGYASNMLVPVTNKLGMLGTYADNAVMIGALWALGKFVPSMKPLAKTGILIESAMVGGELIQQVAPPSTMATNAGLFDGGNRS